MFAIAFVNAGLGGMRPSYGSDGFMKIYHKSMKYILEDTRIMRMNNDEVFLIPYFSQEMSEMNAGRLYDKVVSIGTKIK